MHSKGSSFSDAMRFYTVMSDESTSIQVSKAATE